MPNGKPTRRQESIFQRLISVGYALDVFWNQKRSSLLVYLSIENRDDILGDRAVLLFRSSADTYTTCDFPMGEDRIVAGYKSDAGIVGLNRHQRSAFRGGERNIFRFALGHRGGIRFAWNEGDAKH